MKHPSGERLDEVLRWEARLRVLRRELLDELARRGPDAEQHVAVALRALFYDLAVEQLGLRWRYALRRSA